MENKKILISAAKEISKKYEYPEVIIFAYDPETGIQHMTAYGNTKKRRKEVASIAEAIQKILGWH